MILLCFFFNRCNLPTQFTFSRLSIVTCGGSGQTKENEVTSDPVDLTFHSRQLKSYSVRIEPHPDDVGKLMMVRKDIILSTFISENIVGSLVLYIYYPSQQAFFLVFVLCYLPFSCFHF